MSRKVIAPLKKALLSHAAELKDYRLKRMVIALCAGYEDMISDAHIKSVSEWYEGFDEGEPSIVDAKSGILFYKSQIDVFYRVKN